jgi:hypothetical protein
LPTISKVSKGDRVSMEITKDRASIISTNLSLIREYKDSKITILIYRILVILIRDYRTYKDLNNHRDSLSFRIYKDLSRTMDSRLDRGSLSFRITNLLSLIINTILR